MGSSSRPKKEQSLSVAGREWVRGRILGKGGFGSVYLGWVKKPNLRADVLPSIFAVKSTLYCDALELVRENSLLETFSNCPFIIHRYGEDVTAGIDGNKVFNMFMEYADGGTMRDLINKSGGLPEFQVRKYTEVILKGVKHIHEMGYVHCDLKPENILLVSKTDAGGSEFVPKIGDLGLAKRIIEKRSGGTTLYWSPETVLQNIQLQPSDVWALGCVVLMMLTGRKPWDLKAGARPWDLMLQIASKSPTIPVWLSEEGKDFLGKCFVWSPSERFTAAKLLNHPFVTNLDTVKELSSVSSSPSEQQILPLGFKTCHSKSNRCLPKAIGFPYTWCCLA
ncbi:PREDICTED: mitogen-activated protein kinase kinase kinase 3-like [Prunus mume]|uniref:Mitogen-activated protein kinase kinase kinase 3-like n=1 Tax=Prunus mume TaxID=102107 RepID=A0ABM0NSP4_PRUMU|nr:PREDICTED: mitogen-activated protein kinase kinase kinase 3-like [Prunus mume]